MDLAAQLDPEPHGVRRVADTDLFFETFGHLDQAGRLTEHDIDAVAERWFGMSLVHGNTHLFALRLPEITSGQHRAWVNNETVL